jgi:hypothetical protein
MVTSSPASCALPFRSAARPDGRPARISPRAAPPPAGPRARKERSAAPLTAFAMGSGASRGRLEEWSSRGRRWPLSCVRVPR